MSGTDGSPADASDGVAVGERVEVLLVDDDETWATSTAQILEQQREAFAVETATSLAAASAAFAEGDPDCVVSDYQLERGTGLDLLAEVRDLAPDRPFILITGQGDESVASDAIGREVTDYIPKRSLGGRDDLLARRVEAAVESYRTRRALDRERRSKTAVLDVLTATTGETELYEQFCAQLVEQRGYACAWIGSDGGDGRPVPRAAAGREAFLDALLVGAAQGFAILPGVSRSGTTTSVLLFRGHDGPDSFRLSFLLSIPAAVGGGLHDVPGNPLARILAPLVLVQVERFDFRLDEVPDRPSQLTLLLVQFEPRYVDHVIVPRQ